MKKRIVATVLISSLLLGACGSEITTQKQYIEPKYEETVYFKDKFDSRHIDVVVNKKKKMYRVGEEFDEIVSTLKKDDLIKIEYKIDSELKKVVTDIVIVERKEEVSAKDKNVDKSVSDKIEEEENQEQEEDKVLKVYNGTDYEEEDAKKDIYKDVASVIILDGYKTENTNGDIAIKNSSYNMSATFIPLEDNVDIKKERWSAAEHLEDNGTLKETEEIEVPEVVDGAEFVFYAQGKEYKKYVVVKKINKIMTRININVPNGYVSKEKEYQLWAMINSFEWAEDKKTKEEDE